jgi:hypothetical protein
MRIKTRSQRAGILALLGALVGMSPAFASDYSVDFGVETDAGKDAGTLACRFGEMCDAKVEWLGLRVAIHVFRHEPERATVYLDGGDLSCCYFEYAADKITVDPRKPLYRVPFFKGTRARGGLYVENQRVGTLYLRFHSH